MNIAGVPVELSVAAIFRAMMPLLPMPVTTTRPLHPWSISTALSNAAAMGPAIRSANARKASASIRTTFSPMDFIRGDGIKRRSYRSQTSPAREDSLRRLPLIQKGGYIFHCHSPSALELAILLAEEQLALVIQHRQR